jgi:hypothetical protein
MERYDASVCKGRGGSLCPTSELEQKILKGFGIAEKGYIRRDRSPDELSLERCGSGSFSSFLQDICLLSFLLLITVTS